MKVELMIGTLINGRMGVARGDLCLVMFEKMTEFFR